MTTEEIARLRALLVADPLGTIRWTNDYPDDSDGEAWALVDDEKFPRPYGVLWCDRDNAPVAPHRELIAAAVNALPALLDAAERGLDDGLRVVWRDYVGGFKGVAALAPDGIVYGYTLSPEGCVDRRFGSPHLGDDNDGWTAERVESEMRAHDRKRRGGR